VIRITGGQPAGVFYGVIQPKENGSATPETEKRRSPDSGEVIVPDEPKPEQPALSDELMEALRLVEAKFNELPASGRRLLLAEWVMKLHQQIGYFRCMYELTDALIEVQRGLTPPLFRPMERSGRPALPLIEQDRRSAAALAMEALEKAGKTKEDAARTVARRLGLSLSHGEWREVLRWRDDLARAAKAGGRYSDDFRTQAKIHQIERLHLACSIEERGEDPAALAEKELSRIDQIREILNREK
jgi:hypothetical protein